MCRSKFTPEKQKRITDLLSAGCTRQASYRSAGVPATSFTRWMHARPAFKDAVEEAEAKCEVNFTLVVSKYAKDDPKYALEWLKRMRRSQWGDNVQHGADARFREFMANLLRANEIGDAGGESELREEEDEEE